MKGARTPAGYTIVEVMIVLAISGVIFLIAVQFISGKQAHSSFIAGVDQMTSQIQDTIQQVSAGEYSDVPIDCQAGLPPTFPDPSSSTAQGTNSGCVFVGKFLQFWPSTTAVPTSAYEVFTLAGNRLIGTTSNPATSIADVYPVPVYNSNPDYDLTIQSTIPQGLTINKTGTIKGITIVNSSGKAKRGVYGFGFMESLGSIATGGSDDGTYLSGGQTIDLIYSSVLTSGALNSLTSDPPAYQESQVNSYMRGTQVAYASSAVMCVTNGTQYATISIGYTGSATTSQNLNVTSQILEGQPGYSPGYGSSACH